LKLGITMLIHNKDDIEFVTEFPCFLGHPVLKVEMNRSLLTVPVLCFFPQSHNLYVS